MAISFIAVHSHILNMYKTLCQNVKVGNFELLEEMHHYTSGMKSVYSQICMDGLLTIRQSCGGAGYSAWSGLPYLIDDFSPVPTFEGDNTVMAQQSAKLLIKMFSTVSKGNKLPVGPFKYLEGISTIGKTTCPFTTVEAFTNFDNVFNVLQNLSLAIFKSTNLKLDSSSETEKKKINEIYALDVVKMAQVHIKLITLYFVKDKIKLFTDNNLKSHMCNLMALVGLIFVLEYKSEGYDCGYFKQGAIDMIDGAIKVLLSKIRP